MRTNVTRVARRLDWLVMPRFVITSTAYHSFARHCFSNLSASSLPNLRTISPHIGELRIRFWYSSVIFSSCSGVGGVPGAMKCSPSSSIHENDEYDLCFSMQHFLYFLPLPHKHGSFLPMSFFITVLDILWLRIHFCLDGHSHGAKRLLVMLSVCVFSFLEFPALLGRHRQQSPDLHQVQYRGPCPTYLARRNPAQLP